ncbi:hypothetical protein B0H10DRAFT_1182471 [Mycena sp. CBHHK59/15]|nr:hypothetical protein B0H10DRAFT_1182471 [Mycena sp. CBHHK59/15]
MPVSFSPGKHAATSKDVSPVTAAQILLTACPNQFEQVDRIMQYSMGGRSGPGDTTKFKIVPNVNGFVHTVMSAYSHHYALVVRPDDVWLAILSQFSFYVNANAELLCANFVAHAGKRQLEVSGNLLPDFADLARQMGALIHANVVDPALRDWILPGFSTTTMNDTTVGSMLMMATMKKYLDYNISLMCGIPRVTLEGDRRDWELVLGRLEKLKEYGVQTIAWYHLLVPVISRFASAFDNPNGQENLEFWQKVASKEVEGSGSSYWSGWITAFCVFDADGRWLGPRLDTDRRQSVAPESLPSRRFWSAYTRPLQETRPHLTLDGTAYHIVDTSAVPAGYAEVDVLFNNNGTESQCVIVVGLVGMGFSSSRDLSVSATGINDTVRPVVGWWMYTKLDEAQQKLRRGQTRQQSRWGTNTSGSAQHGVIVVPSVEKRVGRGRRRTMDAPYVVPPPPPTHTTQRVAGQSQAREPPAPAGMVDVTSPTTAPTSNSNFKLIRGRRNSEGGSGLASPGNAISSDTSTNVNPDLPVRSRRASFWKRMLKF